MDDTAIVGLISSNNKAAYREEVQSFSTWCKINDTRRNTNKTTEMITDFRKTKNKHHNALSITSEEVERVASFKFLGVHISDDLSWSMDNPHIIKKAQ